MTLYAATSNEGKLREFATAAQPAGVDVLALPGLGAMPEPVEDAVTFMGNAELKALAYSNLAPGLLVFADDSGLEADALDGAPGVRSARYADDLHFEPGQGSKDERNNRALLSGLQFHTDRSARFFCALALARDGQILLRAEGTVEGQLLSSPKGKDGFGYDPLFFVPSLGLTLAELPREKKWEISHRGNAFRSLLAQIATDGLSPYRTKRSINDQQTL
jgi:XTP/dITP diphosphohydrolase